jgi:hypothetical protein
MKVYHTNTAKLAGSNVHEVGQKALAVYKQIKNRTKRRPYVRSAYFKKEKVFLDLFWSHLYEKNWRDRVRRLRLFAAAIELIMHSRYEPVSKDNPNKASEILHRFAGMTKENDLFYVQIKENKKTGTKRLISAYPVE